MRFFPPTSVQPLGCRLTWQLLDWTSEPERCRAVSSGAPERLGCSYCYTDSMKQNVWWASECCKLSFCLSFAFCLKTQASKCKQCWSVQGSVLRLHLHDSNQSRWALQLQLHVRTPSSGSCYLPATLAARIPQTRSVPTSTDRQHFIQLPVRILTRWPKQQLVGEQREEGQWTTEAGQDPRNEHNERKAPGKAPKVRKSVFTANSERWITSLT